MSDKFAVRSGVRQGGILSPYFFAVYTDELSTQLTNTKLGCKVANLTMNHVFYADDI